MTLYQLARAEQRGDSTIHHEDELIAAEREASRYLLLSVLDINVDDRPIPYEAIDRLTATLDPKWEPKRQATEAFVEVSGREADLNWWTTRRIDAAFRLGMALGARIVAR
ncbi:MAG TPA: hypothetical protein VG871_11275 [Vicinamibacterales bacterium]|jgi:hypothetical protein|nr:hypothetical protein [Vicinamibacterales bacterium]HWB17019.1 hypothetical protein [Vicinamibacterales bacterium]